MCVAHCDAMAHGFARIGHGFSRVLPSANFQMPHFGAHVDAQYNRDFAFGKISKNPCLSVSNPCAITSRREKIRVQSVQIRVPSHHVGKKSVSNPFQSVCHHVTSGKKSVSNPFKSVCHHITSGKNPCAIAPQAANIRASLQSPFFLCLLQPRYSPNRRIFCLFFFERLLKRIKNPAPNFFLKKYCVIQTRYENFLYLCFQIHELLPTPKSA
jgi:hypothetical protein